MTLDERREATYLDTINHDKWVAQGAGAPMCGAHCDACDAPFGSDSHPIRGYASGCELGLCGGCAEFVNTQANISAAINSSTAVFIGE